MGEYKIKDLESLTGIKAHTIRMWEKRYDLLRPERTDTQIRLYTTKDLVELLDISILYNNGEKISKIAKLSVEEREKEVCNIYKQTHSCDIDMSMLIQSMLELKCHDFDRVLTDIIQKKGLEVAYNNCISSFIAKIEELSKTGKVTAVQKHFVFNLIRQKIILETEHLPIAENERFDAVLFTPEGHFNEFCLLYYNYVLQKKNYKTLYLGVNLPTEDLQRALKETNPRRLVVSLAKDGDEEEYKEYIDSLKKSIDLPLYLGGFQTGIYGVPALEQVFSVQDLLV